MRKKKGRRGSGKNILSAFDFSIRFRALPIFYPFSYARQDKVKLECNLRTSKADGVRSGIFPAKVRHYPLVWMMREPEKKYIGYIRQSKPTSGFLSGFGSIPGGVLCLFPPSSLVSCFCLFVTIAPTSLSLILSVLSTNDIAGKIQRKPKARA